MQSLYFLTIIKMTKKPLTSFERKEIKFLLSKKQKQDFLSLIDRYLKADEYGDKGKYQLMSLYYDSPEKDFYREKKMRLPHRKKLRLRRYVGENPKLQTSDQVFVEIKEHTEAMNYKRRVVLTADEAFTLLREWIMSRSIKPEDYAVIKEIETLVSKYSLEPSVVVSYQRQAYKVDKKDGGLRITFDQQVSYRIKQLSLDRSNDVQLLDNGMEIMEIKVKGELPLWTQETLKICGIEQVNFSKYAYALEKGISEWLVPPIKMVVSWNLIHDHKSEFLLAEVLN